jgi:hypothetical protein
VGSLTVTGLGPDGGDIGSGDGSNIDAAATLGFSVANAAARGAIVLASSEGDVRLAEGTAGGQVSLVAAGSVGSTGLIRAQGLSVTGGRDLALNDVIVRSSLDLTASGGAIAGARFESSEGGISLNARDGITLDEAVTGSSLNLGAGGAIRLDRGRAGSDIVVTTQTAEGIRPAADLGTLEAGRDIRVAAGNLPRGTFTAGRDIRLDASSITLIAAEAGDDFVAVTSGGFSAGQVRTTGTGQDVSETAMVAETAATSGLPARAASPPTLSPPAARSNWRARQAA